MWFVLQFFDSLSISSSKTGFSSIKSSFGLLYDPLAALRFSNLSFTIYLPL
ncbi:hypothetical protein NBO_66g0052 [Nosema bombycis CQ1]|uniref:Uncharacterized protein n=1 Tax=Nosema bombycis (strain CQ1 / CVCC 102059) TaxID=578461 RepID=R0ML94_NOSB1|nr:hypothetical protein NBO_66g0052 [Nosema bombycis CQ1]|eukprot:EOB13593.1 hypothetical protein NBO_66g0052 [Nosema bombycis CQ1]